MQKEFEILSIFGPVIIIVFILAFILNHAWKKLDRKATYNPKKYRIYWAILFVTQISFVILALIRNHLNTFSVYLIAMSSLYSLSKLKK